MFKLNKQSVWIQAMYISFILLLCIGVGTAIGRYSTQEEIHYLKTVSEELHKLTIKKSALMLGYSKGLHDGFEAYTRTFNDRKLLWSFSQEWKRCFTNTGKLPLQIEQEKIAIEFLKAQNLYNDQTSNYMIKAIRYYYKDKR